MILLVIVVGTMDAVEVVNAYKASDMVNEKLPANNTTSPFAQEAPDEHDTRIALAIPGSSLTLTTSPIINPCEV